jgi:hypothetical protein
LPAGEIVISRYNVLRPKFHRDRNCGRNCAPDTSRLSGLDLSDTFETPRAWGLHVFEGFPGDFRLRFKVRFIRFIGITIDADEINNNGEM